MKKVLFVLLSSLFSLMLLNGCMANKLVSTVEIQEPKITADQLLVVGMPLLDYASDDTIIFHSHFGLFVYDLTESKIIRSVDLKPIECNYIQGSISCETFVSTDGKIVELHNVSKEEMYVYNVDENKLEKKKYAPMENAFKVTPKEEDIKNYDPRYSFEAIKFDNGESGYLYCEDQKLGNLEYIRGDKRYLLFK